MEEINPSIAGSYPIRIGDSLASHSRKRRYIGVKSNHKLTGAHITQDRDVLKLSSNQQTYSGHSHNSHVLIYDPNDATFVLEDVTALDFTGQQPNLSDDSDAYDYRRYMDEEPEEPEDEDIKVETLHLDHSEPEDDYLTIEEEIPPPRAFRPARPPPIHVDAESSEEEEERVQREQSAASIAEAELEAELLQEMSKLDEQSTPRPVADEEESEEE